MYKKKLEGILQGFYHWIEQEICEVQKVPTLIEKEVFLKSTMILMNQVREYLKGVEETGISKNILLQVRTRYGYLPVMHQLIGKYYPQEVKVKKLEENTNT